MRARSFVAVVASVHLAAAAGVFAFASVTAGPLDGGMHGAGVFLALGSPAGVALLGLRDRWPLVLAATLCAAVQAFVPFSVHSFFLAPLAALYGVGYLSRPERPRLVGWRTASALVVLPLVAVATFVAPSLVNNPWCYEQTRGGEITYVPSPQALPGLALDADGDVVRRGCTSKVPGRTDSTIRAGGLLAMAALGASARPERRRG